MSSYKICEQSLKGNRFIIKEPLKVTMIKYPFLHGHHQFFNPNICHYCKSRGEGDLISCRDCNMISYCKESHRKKHYKKSHGVICKILNTVMRTTPQPNSEIVWPEWIQFRKRLLEKVSQKIQQDLNRPIKEYEKQMILRAKACLVCCRQNNLQTCPSCLSVNYCFRHGEHFREIHLNRDCTYLLLSLNIEIEKMFNNSIPQYDELFSHPVMTFNATEEDLLKYLKHPTSKIHLKAADYILSDYISAPLTIYRDLKYKNLLNNVIVKGSKFIVHIIDVNCVDRNSLRAWEILFHLLYELREMIIICVGPGLEFISDEINVCLLCKIRDKKFTFMCIPMSYFNYLKSPYSCKEANIIVGFGEGNFEWHPFSRTVQAIQAVKCPLFLSGLSKLETDNIRDKIKDATGKRVKPISRYRNNFHSLLPYRNMEIDYICFRNSYFVIYSNLNKRNYESCDDESYDDESYDSESNL